MSSKQVSSTTVFLEKLNQAAQLQERGEWFAAENIYNEVLAYDDQEPNANHMLALIFFTRDQNCERAMYHLKKAEHELNKLSTYWLNRSRVESEFDLSQAQLSAERALTLEPDDGSVVGTLADILLAQNKVDEACTYFERAISCTPLNVISGINYAVLLNRLNRLNESLAVYRKLDAHVHEDDNLQFNHSFLLLRCGRLLEGWSLNESRMRLPEPTLRVRFPIKAWQGESLAGKTILLVTEQGLGDNIQFVRFSRLLQRCGARVTLMAPRELFTLMTSCPYIDEVVPSSTNLDYTAYDYWVSTASLPYYFAIEAADLPGPVPYLYADPVRVTFWRDYLHKHAPEHLRIGFVWLGNPDHPQNQLRTIAVDHWLPLLTIPGTMFFSLQKGKVAKDILKKNKAMEVVHDLSDQLVDFSETAAVLQALDIVISCDTSVVHVSGALGVEVWSPIPFSYDWRWGLADTTTPWYPSMRIFRQYQQDDWQDVMQRLSATIKQRIGEQVTAPSPEPTQASLPAQHGRLIPPKLSQLAKKPKTATAETPTLAAQNVDQNVDQNDHRPKTSSGQSVTTVERTKTSGRLMKEIERAAEYQMNNQFEEAKAVYQRVLKEAPNNGDAVHLMAVVLHQLGEHQQALPYFERALELLKAFPAVYLNYASVLTELCLYEKANEIIAQGKKFDTKNELERSWYLSEHKNAKKMRKFDRALELGKKLIELDGDQPQVESYCGVASVYFDQNDYDNAEKYYNRALELEPKNISVLSGKASIFNVRNQIEHARACFKQCLEINPENANLHNSYGNFLLSIGDLDLAEKYYQHCLELKNDTFCRYNYGYYLLHTLQFEQGWTMYAERSNVFGYERLLCSEQPKNNVPEWHGEPLAGKRIVLVGEQGLGDQIHFVRFVSLIAKLGATVDLVVSKLLVSLCAQIPGVSQVTDCVDPDVQYDYWSPLLHSPIGLKIYTQQQFMPEPYLWIDQESARNWYSMLAKVHPGKPRIGLAWYGNGRHSGDIWRSMPFEYFVPLLATTDVTFFSLHPHPRDDFYDADTLLKNQVIGVGLGLDSFLTTTGLLANLDLVISVDTSLAHLCGACGVPTWLMLAHNSDWRWEARQDNGRTSWYDSVTIFKQKKRNDWPGVIAEINASLSAYCQDVIDRKALKSTQSLAQFLNSGRMR